MRAILAVALLAIILGAGCAGPAGPESATFTDDSGPVAASGDSGAHDDGSSPAPSTSTASDAPAPSDETGTIEVTVVTTETIPVGAASVTLDGTDRALFTGEDGLAVFDALEPRAYTVLVAKPGYRTLDARGRAVDVVAGERATVRIILDPVPVLTENLTYHTTFPFRGHISCSYAIGGQSSSSVCGRGVTPASGTTVNDPNDNSSHPFEIENIQVREIILEATWQPSVGALGSQLFVGLSNEIVCTAYQYCRPDANMGGAGGSSPVRYDYPPNVDYAANKRFGETPDKFPAQAWVTVYSFCSTGCTFALTLEQDYDAYATAFYGERAPPGWSVFSEE